MQKHTKIVLIAVLLGVLLILIVALIAGLSVHGKDDVLVLPESLDASKCPGDYGFRPVLLISLDGFRPDFLQRKLTPTIQELAEKGVHAEYMMSSYPTVTFPNHYTIVTGLYPEVHGIIDNNFLNPETREYFSRSNDTSKDGKWWGGEPIWNTITGEGKKSATFFWPGSEADINGKYPTYSVPYNGSISFEDRVLKVLEWLSLPSRRRPSWVSLYFDEPDHAGHGHGPDSEEVNEQLKRVDGVINLLMRGLIERKLVHCVNVIILSDHGQVEAGEKRIIELKEYLPDLKKEAFFKRGVVGGITPYNKSEEVKEDFMKKLACRKDEMRVFAKEGLPKRLHFAKNQLIYDIVIELDPGYTVQHNDTWALNGQHGYDNYFPTMKALFLAYGPDFQQQLKVQPFQNIELYNLMCHLVGVQPAENNGTEGALNHLLVNPPATPQLPKVDKPPVLKEQHLDRWNMSGCDMNEPSQQSRMASLDMADSQVKQTESQILPWGIPRPSRGVSGNFSLLYHPDHITGYSSGRKMPLWTSFTLRKETIDVTKLQPKMDEWTSDTRLPIEDSPECDTFRDLEALHYSTLKLFPDVQERSVGQRRKVNKTSTSYLVTNAIPVHNDLIDSWTHLISNLEKWVKAHGPFNVLLGPVFDSNDNPHLDQSMQNVPSDLFAVVTRCLDDGTLPKDCSSSHLDTRSFILHQYQIVKNCYKNMDYLTKFSATVRDVELATGLTLYPALPFTERVNLTLRIHPSLWG